MKRFNLINTLVSTFLINGGLMFTSISYAETAVIVHPSNTITMSKKDIQRIFLGKSKIFPGGRVAIPIDLSLLNPARKKFGKAVLGKSILQVKSYWARTVFTGRGIPPKEADGQEELKKLVAANPNTIGYIDASSLDNSVKVILKF